MRNFVQDGDIITAVAPYALTSGQGAQVGSALFGVAAADAAISAEVQLSTEGVFDITALGTDTGVAGTKWYWDNGNRRLTTTASAHICAGVGINTKASGDTAARIKLVLGFDKA